MVNTNNSIHSKSLSVALALGIIAGLKKHYVNGSQVLTFPGGLATSTVDATVGKLQAIVDNRAAVVAARSALADKLKAEDAARVDLDAFLVEVEGFVRYQFGGDPNALADFAVKPRAKPKPLTAEQKAARAAKAKATRQLRDAAKKAAAKATVAPAPSPAPATPPVTAPAAAPTPAKG